MFQLLLYLIWKLYRVIRREEALFPPLALPGVTLELLREYLLEHSSEVGRISCFEEPTGACCETGGIISASQMCNAHLHMGICHAERGKLRTRQVWVSTPTGEIRWETLCGCSLGGLCGQATVHTWGLSKCVSHSEILLQPRWGIVLPSHTQTASPPWCPHAWRGKSLFWSRLVHTGVSSLRSWN